MKCRHCKREIYLHGKRWADYERGSYFCGKGYLQHEPEN